MPKGRDVNLHTVGIEGPCPTQPVPLGTRAEKYPTAALRQMETTRRRNERWKGENEKTVAMVASTEVMRLLLVSWPLESTMRVLRDEYWQR